MDWQTLLITVFVYIGEQYKTQLWPFCQRMSNNNNPQFSDEELLTIFLYGVMKKRFELKDIYNYADSHLREWFPHLPSYVAFVQRLNRFDSLFPMLIELKDYANTVPLLREISQLSKSIALYIDFSYNLSYSFPSHKHQT